MEEKVDVLLFNLPRQPLAIDQGGEERGSLYNLLVSWAAGDRWLLGFVPKCGMREEPGQTKNHISVSDCPPFLQGAPKSDF